MGGPTDEDHTVEVPTIVRQGSKYVPRSAPRWPHSAPRAVSARPT